jgi:predicted RNA-binding Zn ribbon-like protein
VKHSFHRGSLALDFIGTVGFRRSNAPLERIPDAAEFGAWLAQAGLVSAQTALPSDDDYERALRLRATLWRAGSALADGSTPAGADRAAINDAACETRGGHVALDEYLELRATSERPIDFALGRIASDAIEVFARKRERLMHCELADCGGLLLANERGERRRWCSMELCGNRAKVAAHRKRRTEQSLGKT